MTTLTLKFTIKEGQEKTHSLCVIDSDGELSLVWDNYDDLQDKEDDDFLIKRSFLKGIETPIAGNYEATLHNYKKNGEKLEYQNA